MRYPGIFTLFISGFFLFTSQYLNAQNCDAAFTWDNTDLTIQFTDLSTSDSGDPIVSWFWDFDDSTTSDEQNPSHTFPSPDIYNIVLVITTDSGCTAEIEIQIETCAFNISVDVGDCDANDEVEITITVEDIYDNAKDIDILIDGLLLPGSPFEIDSSNPVVVTTTLPGDGLDHTIEILSTDISTCTGTLVFSVPDCVSDCFLSGLNVNFAGGVTHTVNVDGNFFSPENTTIVISDIVEFNWVDGGHSTTSDATTGPDSWNSGVQDVGFMYDVTLTNPGVHPFYCIPHGGPGGAGMSGQLIANCPDGDEFDLTLTFNTTADDPAGYNVRIDGNLQPGSPHLYNGTGPQSVSATLLGDGLSHTFQIEDVADPSCFISKDFLAPDCGAAPECSLTLSAIETGGCDPSNNVSVEVTITSINGGASGFNLLVDATNVGTYNYDVSGTTVVTIDVAGDGSSHTIEAQDIDDPACTASTTITTTDCTIPCSITNLTATSGSASTYVVLVEDFEFIPASVTITSGDIVEWQWIGTVEHTSTSDATSGPDSWDSGLLGQGSTYQSPVLTTGIHPYYCIPHGGPGGSGMSGTITVQADCTNGEVSVLVSFDESGGSINGFDVLVDAVNVGTFDYDASGTTSITIMVAGDGQDHTIEVIDADDPGCTASVIINTPDCDAPTCQLTASAEEVGGCDASNNVTVDVTITDTGGGASGFNLLVDATNVGTYAYDPSGNTVISIDISGDGSSHTIETQDIDDPACTASTTVTTTDCNLPCSLSNLSLTILGGGNPVTHNIEVIDFEFVPADVTISQDDIVHFEWTGAIQHTSTSDETSGPDSWDSGLLGQGATYDVTISGEGDHLYYCVPHGAPGGIGMAGVITAIPPSPCDNGNVTVQISFDDVNGSNAGFEIIMDGNSLGNYSYDPSGSTTVTVIIPGDGTIHSFEIQDLDDPSCSLIEELDIPDCNQSGSCNLTLTAAQVSDCDSNNEIGVELTINSENVGAGYDILIDGNLYPGGPFNYDSSNVTIHTINVEGTGLSRTIEIQDIDSTSCIATTIIETPECGSPCEISNLIVNNSSQPSKYFIEVKDFEFLTANLDILVGDTVEFFWTGAIEHTTTSDATSGPNSWDSGLLGQGATYQIVISEAGVHPYYCIPHGGPGGVGMAGIINASSLCNDGMVIVELTFNSTGTGSGFNILIDGSLDLNGPYSYALNGENSFSVELIGDGNQHEIIIEDVEDTNCNAVVIFEIPLCDNACILDLNITQEGCNDNDEVPLDLTVISQNEGIGGFNIYVDGNLYTGSPFSYNVNDTTSTTIYISGDGNQHEITIEDVDQMECSNSQIVDLPLCTSDCILEIIANQTSVCDDQQELSYELMIQSLNPGSLGFNILINNDEHPNNPFDYNQNDTTFVSIILSGDGSTYEIQALDIENTECSASTNIITPNCEEECALDIQTISINVPKIHVVEVHDFEFLPTEIIVEVGDIVRFEWVGVIPHTSTSDAISGDDTWNSGLLGQGEMFEITINNAGTHPYYCIPHGAPGGVGMAGVIYADEPCDDDSLSVEIMFVSNNEGLNGYNVFLDGTITAGSPIGYDPTGIHSFVVEIIADGMSHELIIQDVDNPNCSVDTTFVIPDCDDPCFGFDADFDFEIDFQTLAVNFTDESVGIPDSWLWYFGDGETSTEQHPEHIYLQESVYEVCLIVENSTIGCSDTICKTIDLEQYVCQAIYSYEIENLTVHFTDESITNATIDNWIWDLESGLQIVGQQNPSFTFDSLGIYNVCLTIEADSCVSDTCLLIDLSDPCLSFQPEFSFTQNESSLGVQFLNLSTGNANQWLWGFGDGNTSNEQNPYYEYDEPGTYNVCLLVQDTINGCNASSCETVMINTTGIKNQRFEKRLLVIYPNPSRLNNPSWTIEGILEKDIGKELHLKIYDYLGKTIIENKDTGKNQITVNCTKTISAGIYIIEIRSDETVYRGRIIAQ